MLESDNIHVNYGRLQALRGVSITVAEGEVVCLVGPNGAGKSTTLAAIAGGVTPPAGSIRLQGRGLVGLPPEAITRLGVSLVPEGRHVFATLTVAENLRIGGFQRRDRGGAAADFERMLGHFPRLRERLRQPAGQLSGGEQQMLAIGRALMNRPTLLLLDEPSLGLSPILVKEIFTIIKRVNEEQGMPILLVEQNAKVALETAHYGYVLEIGRVVMNDSCERLMHSKDIQEFYLGAKEAGARGERRWKKKKTWR